MRSGFQIPSCTNRENVAVKEDDKKATEKSQRCVTFNVAQKPQDFQPICPVPMPPSPSPSPSPLAAAATNGQFGLNSSPFICSIQDAETQTSPPQTPRPSAKLHFNSSHRSNVDSTINASFDSFLAENSTRESNHRRRSGQAILRRFKSTFTIPRCGSWSTAKKQSRNSTCTRTYIGRIESRSTSDTTTTTSSSTTTATTSSTTSTTSSTSSTSQGSGAVAAEVQISLLESGNDGTSLLQLRRSDVKHAFGVFYNVDDNGFYISRLGKNWHWMKKEGGVNEEYLLGVGDRVLAVQGVPVKLLDSQAIGELLQGCKVVTMKVLRIGPSHPPTPS